MALPVAPTGLEVEGTYSDVVKLDWDTMSDADSYRVYKSTDGVNYTQIAEVDVSYYDDWNVAESTTYYYKVASVNADGEGPASSVSTTTAAVSMRAVYIGKTNVFEMDVNSYASLTSGDAFVVYAEHSGKFVGRLYGLTHQVGDAYYLTSFSIGDYPAYSVYLVDASGGAVTVDISDVNYKARGTVLRIKKVDSSSNTVTIDAGSAIIEGSSTVVLSSQYESVTMIYCVDGKWYKF